MVVDQYGTIEDRHLVSIGCDEEKQHKGYDTRMHGWKTERLNETTWVLASKGICRDFSNDLANLGEPRTERRYGFR